MPDSRPYSRRKRRYLVEWRRAGCRCTGFTHDISPTGIFVRSTYIPELGTALTLQLALPEGEKLQVRGTVVRSRRVPSNLRRFVPSGFCIRLTEAPEEYFRLLANLFGLRFVETEDASSLAS